MKSRHLTLRDIVISMFIAFGLMVGAVAYVDYTYGDDVNNPGTMTQTIWNSYAGIANNVIPYSAMLQLPPNTMGGNPTGATANIAAIDMPSCGSTASALTWTTNTGIGCNTSINAATVNGFTPVAVLSGTSNSIGGGLLSVGTCATGTANVPGAALGMVSAATPNTYPGDGVQFQSYVSSSNTVTVKACALLLITPTATTYNVRVLQ